MTMRTFHPLHDSRRSKQSRKIARLGQRLEELSMTRDHGEKAGIRVLGTDKP
jgi:hypothetical protein